MYKEKSEKIGGESHISERQPGKLMQVK